MSRAESANKPFKGALTFAQTSKVLVENRENGANFSNAIFHSLLYCPFFFGLHFGVLFFRGYFLEVNFVRGAKSARARPRRECVRVFLEGVPQRRQRTVAIEHQ